jgi:hypothetical protein
MQNHWLSALDLVVADMPLPVTQVRFPDARAFTDRAHASQDSHRTSCDYPAESVLAGYVHCSKNMSHKK